MTQFANSNLKKNKLDDFPKNDVTIGFLSAYLIILSIILYSFFREWAYDDPYITYRYAENLRMGYGFVYNTGERVLSTTTPLFTIVLALFSFVWPNIPRLANCIGAISLVFGGIFLWDLSRTWKSPTVGWTALLLFPTFPLLISSLGSESPLYVSLCLGAFVFYARRRYGLTAAFSALAMLTRADGVLVPFVLALYFLYREGGRRLSSEEHQESLPRIRGLKRIPWNAVALFLGLTLPWYIFSWIYFGSPFPVTLVTKQYQGAMAISQRFAPGIMRILAWFSPSWQYWLAACIVIVGLVYVIKRARQWRILLIWMGLYFTAYSLLGVSSYFWYYTPLVPGYVVLLGLGISAFIYLGSQVRQKGSVNIHILSQVLSVVVVIVLFFAQVSSLNNLRQGGDKRYEIYRTVGEWLNTNTPSDATVAALEVGIIGYYAHRPMIDFAGLITPNVAAHMSLNTTYEDAAIWALEEYNPSYLILFVGDYPSIEQGYAAEYCRPVQNFIGSDHGFAADLQIYRCQE